MINSSYDDNYDSLDVPSAPYSDRIHEPETFHNYITFIKLGNQVKDNLVKHTERETTVFLLSALRSIIIEQTEAQLLDKDTAFHIYNGVKDQAERKGWIEWNE